MIRRIVLRVALAYCAWMGCGAKTAPYAPVDGATEASAATTPDTDAATKATTAPLDAATETPLAMNDAASSPTTPRICDGSSTIRLAVQLGGGGPPPAGVAMLAENGYQFLFVDGTCHAWVLVSPYDSTRQVTLTAAQEETLSDSLKIGAWKDVSAPSAGGGCADGSSIDYRFEKQHLSGPTCGVAAGTPWSNLNTSFQDQIVALADRGMPGADSVRYLVLRNSSGASSDPRTPVAWPLANVDPGTVAQNPFEYQAGSSQQASGSDATALRAIRTTTSASSSGPAHYDTPIRASDGTLYTLYVRDALPFESDNGLLPQDLF